MLKINLEKELEKQRNISNVSFEKEDKLQELKLLLATNAVEERQILKEAGLDFNIVQLEKIHGQDLERKKFETEMKNPLFTENEIKKLCIKYNLKFSRSKTYKGTIEPVLGASIIEFFKSRKIDGINLEAANNLFIMAPECAFNIQKDENFKNSNDPILFYRISAAKEVPLYALIHKWGNDFTISRRINGFFYKNETNYNILSFIRNYTIFAALFALITTNLFVILLSPIPFSIVFHIIWFHYKYHQKNKKYGLNTHEKEDRWHNKFSEKGWNIITSNYYY